MQDPRYFEFYREVEHMELSKRLTRAVPPS